jgi:hypothetical protein
MYYLEYGKIGLEPFCFLGPETHSVSSVLVFVAKVY